MKLYVDSANLSEIEQWCNDDRIDGVTTNPSLMKAAGVRSPLSWAKDVVRLANGKSVSIDGPPDVIWGLGPNVLPKVAAYSYLWHTRPVNITAVCTEAQTIFVHRLTADYVLSVFAGRIMDTGRDPQPVIDAAKKTGASVLWGSVREPYNIIQAEQAGCDIVTVTPVILEKYLEWTRYSLSDVAAKTIGQFEKDAEGLQW